MATYASGYSAMCTGTPISFCDHSSRFLRSAPLPARTIPRFMMSGASSGGVRSRVSLTAATMALMGKLMAFLTSSLVITKVLGSPVTRS